MRAPRAARPARVIFVNRYFHPDQSATSRMVSDLAFRLADQGILVAALTSRQLYEDPRAHLAVREQVHGVAVRRLSTFTLGRGNLVGRALDYLSFHLAAGLVLLAMLRAGDVVVAKTDPPLIGIVCGMAARCRGARLVNWLQDLFPDVAAALTPGLLPVWLHRCLTALRDRSLRAAQMNVAIGAGMRARLLQRGIPADLIRIIPNWADSRAIVPMAASDSRIRADLGLQDRFVVGYSGNFGRAHEFHTLLGAAQWLQADSRFAFLMTGGGARHRDLREAAARARLSSFHFQDYQPVDRLADALGAADVHLVSLLPQLEGLILPSKVYGILAAGRPVVFVGDPQGDVAQMLRDHECGLSVPVGEDQQLAEELRALAQDPRRVRLMGANARRLALARYTSELAAGDWTELLCALHGAKPLEHLS